MGRVGLLFISIFLIASCSVNDDTVEPSALDGKWVLDSVVCFCFFGDDFDFSAHTLEFDSSKKSVEIENLEPDSNWFIAVAGSHEYSDSGAEVVINGKAYTYTINGNSLVLSFMDSPNIADDEISLTYTRG